MKACAEATGVPKKILQRAKYFPDSPGFNRSSGSTRINWTALEPWLKEHREELEGMTDKSLDELKLEGVLLDNIIKQQTIDKNNRESLDPEEVYQFGTDLLSLMSAEVKAMRSELTSKCPGYEKQIDDAAIKILVSITKELEKWKR
jgi:hypothetical protein